MHTQGEREASLRLKGENGIMRKKFNALQKDIEAQKEEIKNLFEQVGGWLRRLYNARTQEM